MSIVEFKGKAQTLEQLETVLTSARTLPLYRFSVSQYNLNPSFIIEEIKGFTPSLHLAVRSSAVCEDIQDISNAGHFKSVLNVKRSQDKSIHHAIERVIQSFGNATERDEVFVQPMLEDVALSGVIFTSDLDTLGPYYVINYDDSGLTDGVTSGRVPHTFSYIHYKESPVTCPDSKLHRLIVTAQELEKIFACTHLDIEFALTRNDEVYILQVRPIVKINKCYNRFLDLKPVLEKVYKKTEKLSQQHPNLLGNRTFFGLMPDWNPAEMIGIRPRPLALSLYKELVTDSIWAYQRDNYGYRNLRSHPLLISFLGIPYIDMRVDFNSFIPADLDDHIAEKLVNYYLDRLEEHPQYHDKVEFQIVYSCYHFSLTEQLAILRDSGFNENEIKRIEFSLLRLTNRIIDSEQGLLQRDIQKIDILKDKYRAITSSDLSIVDKIYWLTEDCKRYGTLPFAGIARAAFIAVQFLNSFVELGIFSCSEREHFMKSLKIVSSDLQSDLVAYQNKSLNRDQFIDKYGHLRPGTYDILSQRYDEDFDRFFSQSVAPYRGKVPFSFHEKQLSLIDRLCKEHGLIVDSTKLIAFIRSAIEGREYAKLVFTKSVSQILCLIELLGKKTGLTREDCSFLDFQTVLNLYSQLDPRDVHDMFTECTKINRDKYHYSQQVKLPILIRKPNDVYSYSVQQSEPNYITRKRIKAKVQVSQSGHLDEVKDRIVLIRSADPGFDYLFARGIAGLITQFGGSNSHMAIRCAELGIPAVIGAGDSLYNHWSRAKMLDLDCENRSVYIVY